MNKLFKIINNSFFINNNVFVYCLPMSAKQQYIFGIINILLLFIIGSKKSKNDY